MYVQKYISEESRKACLSTLQTTACAPFYHIILYVLKFVCEFYEVCRLLNSWIWKQRQFQQKWQFSGVFIVYLVEIQLLYDDLVALFMSLWRSEKKLID